MHCNIDQRGRRARFRGGVLFIAAGVALALLTLLAGWSLWLYIMAAVLALAGGFGIFEARKGWCAFRAMGIRTPV